MKNYSVLANQIVSEWSEQQTKIEFFQSEMNFKKFEWWNLQIQIFWFDFDKYSKKSKKWKFLCVIHVANSSLFWYFR